MQIPADEEKKNEETTEKPAEEKSEDKQEDKKEQKKQTDKKETEKADNTTKTENKTEEVKVGNSCWFITQLKEELSLVKSENQKSPVCLKDLFLFLGSQSDLH